MAAPPALNANVLNLQLRIHIANTPNYVSEIR